MWRFLSSPFYRLSDLRWSCSLANISDFVAATCARGARMRAASLPHTPFSPCRPLGHRPPDPACAYGTWRAPGWTAPSHDRSATRTLSPLELPTPAQSRSTPVSAFATSRRLQGRAVRHAPGLDKPPQGHEQLARQGDHPAPASAATPMPTALLIPLRQRAVGLTAQPAPGQLDGHRAAGRVAGFGDALLVSGGATRLGRGRQAAQGADCLPIAQRPPTAALHHTQPGTLDPNPFAQQQWLHCWRHGILRRLEPGAAFGFPWGTALRQRHPLCPLLPATVVESRQERGAVPQAEVRPLLCEVPAGGHPQAMRRE
jgi:hypothetical protein